MPGIIGKKIGMTSVFNQEGINIPCTVIEAGPCVVTQVKTKEKDGYEAVQLGFKDKKEKHCTKAATGHFKKSGSTAKKKLVEFNGFQNVNAGDKITVDLLQEGNMVVVTGISKGKGFQGVVRRHNFSGVGERSHGQHDRQRAPGSIGASSYPSKVVKGMRMAGQMGCKRTKMFNLQVVKIISDKNLLLLRGSVPGFNGSYLIIEM